jgi:hypothetical protein
MGITTRWYFMTKGIMRGSTGYSYKDQIQAISDAKHYELPTAMERIVGNILYYYLNGKYLDDDLYTSTSSKGDSGLPVVVRGTSRHGIDIDFVDAIFERTVPFGVSASRLIEGE